MSKILRGYYVVTRSEEVMNLNVTGEALQKLLDFCLGRDWYGLTENIAKNWPEKPGGAAPLIVLTAKSIIEDWVKDEQNVKEVLDFLKTESLCICNFPFIIPSVIDQYLSNVPKAATFMYWSMEPHQMTLEFTFATHNEAFRGVLRRFLTEDEKAEVAVKLVDIVFKKNIKVAHFEIDGVIPNWQKHLDSMANAYHRLANGEVQMEWKTKGFVTETFKFIKYKTFLLEIGANPKNSTLRYNGSEFMSWNPKERRIRKKNAYSNL